MSEKPKRDFSKVKGFGKDIFTKDLPPAEEKKAVQTAKRPAKTELYKLTLKVPLVTNYELEEAVLKLSKKRIKATKSAIIALAFDLIKDDLLAGKYDGRLGNYVNRG